jgi:hypothetical protein
MPAVIDFARSFMTFFLPVNVARIQFDAACTLTSARTGESHTYYLIAPCRAEEMYRDRDLFLLPNYEFCGIFSADECLLIRTHWQSDRDNREHGLNTIRFTEVRLDIRTLPTEELPDDAAIVAATLANAPLVARTTLRDAASDVVAVIEYPVKTMNVLPVGQQFQPGGPRFQVDTGPILLPDFASAARPIERFDLAHIVYNRATQLEAILRRPVPLGPGHAAVTDYSVVQTLPAHTTLFQLP